jgi:hypothetical protein
MSDDVIGGKEQIKKVKRQENVKTSFTDEEKLLLDIFNEYLKEAKSSPLARFLMEITK